MTISTKTKTLDNLKLVGLDSSYAADSKRLARTLKLINGRTDIGNADNVGSYVIVEMPHGFIQFLDNVREGDLHSFIMEVSPVGAEGEQSIGKDFQAALEECGFHPLGKYGIWRREFDALASRNYEGLAQLTIGLFVAYYGLKPTDCLGIGFHLQNFVNRLLPIDEIRLLTGRNYKDFRGLFAFLIEEDFDLYAYSEVAEQHDMFRVKRLVDFMDAFLTVALEQIDELKLQDPQPYEVIDEIESLHTIINEKLIDLKAKYRAELFN